MRNGGDVSHFLIYIVRGFYSCPNLVVAKMEELISRPFVGQIQFQLVLQKDMGTESAIGCLVFSLALTFFVSQKFAVLRAAFQEYLF